MNATGLNNSNNVPAGDLNLIKKFLRIRASSCVHPDGLFRGVAVEDTSLASSFTVSAIVSLSDGNGKMNVK